jgi:hypothetical protein
MAMEIDKTLMKRILLFIGTGQSQLSKVTLGFEINYIGIHHFL